MPATTHSVISDNAPSASGSVPTSWFVFNSTVLSRHPTTPALNHGVIPVSLLLLRSLRGDGARLLRVSYQRACMMSTCSLSLQTHMYVSTVLLPSPRGMSPVSLLLFRTLVAHKEQDVLVGQHLVRRARRNAPPHTRSSNVQGSEARRRRDHRRERARQIIIGHDARGWRGRGTSVANSGSRRAGWLDGWPLRRRNVTPPARARSKGPRTS